MARMFSSRVALVLACAGTLSLAACGNNTSTSTTSPSPTPADATITESVAGTVTVGGGLFYSFSMAQYGNVALTLTGVSGDELPDGFTLGLGIGRPSGTGCLTSSTVSASPGDTAQLTGVYGPGIFCVRIYDAGVLVKPANVTASVAHS